MKSYKSREFMVVTELSRYLGVSAKEGLGNRPRYRLDPRKYILLIGLVSHPQPACDTNK